MRQGFFRRRGNAGTGGCGTARTGDSAAAHSRDRSCAAARIVGCGRSRKQRMAGIRAAARSAVLILLLIPALALSGCSGQETGAPGQIGTAAISGSVEVSLFYGMQPELPADTRIPVEVSLSGDYAAAGNLVSVTVPTNAEDYYVYTRPASEAADGHLTFLVSPAPGSSRIMIRVSREDGQQIYSRTTSYQIGTQTADDILPVAVALSEEQNIDSWSQYSSFNGRSIFIHVGSVQSTRLPSDEAGYGSLAALMIDAASADSLSDAQRTALFAWQRGGGNILYLGTEAQARSYGLAGVETPSSWQISERAVLYSFESDSRPLWCMDRSDFLVTMGQGSGREILSILCNDAWASYRSAAEEALTDAAESLCAAQSEDTAPADLPFFAILFVVYIALLTLVSLVLLRKRSRGLLYRAAAIALSAVLAAVIWVRGGSTRITEPFERGVVILQISGENVREKAVFSLHGPVGTGFSFILPQAGGDGREISALQSGQTWSDTTYARADRSTLEITETESSTSIQSGTVSTFAPRYFGISRDLTGISQTENDSDSTENIGNTESQEASPSVSISTGSDGNRRVTNRTGRDLTQAVILDGDQLWMAGELPAGRTVLLENSDALSAEGILSSGVWPEGETPWSGTGLYLAWLQEASLRQTEDSVGVLLFAAAGSDYRLQGETGAMPESNLLFLEAEVSEGAAADAEETADAAEAETADEITGAAEASEEDSADAAAETSEEDRADDAAGRTEEITDETQENTAGAVSDRAGRP